MISNAIKGAIERRQAASKSSESALMLGTLLRPVFWAFLVAMLAVCPARAQQQPQQQTPPAAPPAPAAPQKPGQPKAAPQAKPDPEDDPKYDAFHAEQDIEVGMFYLHKGDTDAAITRFEHAAGLRPNYGKPRLLLAEAYEKKHDSDTALKYYKEYLKVYPDAPDAKKIQRKIEKLSSR
jgi:tetratricopeptide (TPR) repeat protein